MKNIEEDIPNENGEKEAFIEKLVVKS